MRAGEAGNLRQFHFKTNGELENPISFLLLPERQRHTNFHFIFQNPPGAGKIAAPRLV